MQQQIPSGLNVCNSRRTLQQHPWTYFGCPRIPRAGATLALPTPERSPLLLRPFPCLNPALSTIQLPPRRSCPVCLENSTCCIRLLPVCNGFAQTCFQIHIVTFRSEQSRLCGDLHFTITFFSLYRKSKNAVSTALKADVEWRWILNHVWNFPLIKNSASLCSEDTLWTDILGSKLILSVIKSKETFRIRDTCFIVRLPPLNNHYDCSFLIFRNVQHNFLSMKIRVWRSQIDIGQFKMFWETVMWHQEFKCFLGTSPYNASPNFCSYLCFFFAF